MTAAQAAETTEMSEFYSPPSLPPPPPWGKNDPAG